MKKMYTPLQIAGMEIKNRTFMAPMSLGYESQDGTVNEKMAGYWLRRAKGGVGCIIVDATSVDPNVPYLGNTLCFRDEESIKKYKSFTDQIHAYGCKPLYRRFYGKTRQFLRADFKGILQWNYHCFTVIRRIV